jgi:murein L,D-transpeptidase YafK
LTIIIRRLFALALLLGLVAALGACSFKPGNAKANQPLKQAVVQKLKMIGSSPGEAMAIRIFKESSELEVWKRTAGGDYKLFQTYEICAWSGDLGPKFQEGDRQSPEGFYTITPGLLNPNSNYYLAFNTGFPNKYDRAHGRTGSNLMVHGDCSSRGCYSMTDESIAEIYALVRESFAGGNSSAQLQIFPFRMTPANLARHASSPHLAFWKDIKEGYDRFELTKRPPTWDVCGREYVFDVPRGNGVTVLDAAAACPAGIDDTTMTAALQQKQVADEAAMQAEVATLADKEARTAAAAERVAAEEAALRARGAAIGSFIGGVFGAKDADVRKVVNPSLRAPMPAPRIKRG